ncbi:MAG: M28 family peptidase [Sphingobacteriales bacterium]|nr:MAG: M28 family peptidase [Sphingobacteriales bacterium]
MKYLLCLSLLFTSTLSQAQDIAFGKAIVDTLTKPYFWGRGYTKDGMKKAADFLSAQLSSYGLKPLSNDSYLQSFTYPANTFPGAMTLIIDGKALTPGRDFLVTPNSKGINAKGTLRQLDSAQFISEKNKLAIILKDTLNWSAAPVVADYTVIEVRKRVVHNTAGTFDANIENEFVKKFKAANVCAMVKGTRQPDSFIFITAHYDHLGGMGSDTYFPGANDNASGIALLLNLARYYAVNPQPYSIGFICFAGEEIGLKGSEYYTKNPLVPLKRIRFLLNTDLAGTGHDGITVVNAKEYPNEFRLMNEINDAEHLLPVIKSRGKAANSDHYYFSEKGVPAFFFYTMGGIAAYHDINDRGETLPLNEHEDLFKLVVKFNERLMAK